ncbi:MAG: hypothetical protein V2A76_05755 [Planctomycetota bacterium]
MRTDILKDLPQRCRLQLQQIADHHEKELLEQALDYSPGDFDLLVRLGELYPRLGRPLEALKIDLKLIVMAPADPIVRYNLACSLALTGKVAAAMGALRDVIRLGYSDLEHLMKDADLKSVREQTSFQEIIQLLMQHRPPHLA